MFYFSALRGEAACHPRKGIIPFLSAVLAAELSCVVSFIVNNAFSFSYMLKFVLKHFRKLVGVESYFNFESLGPPTSVPPVFFPHSLSWFFFFFITIFQFFLWGWISKRCIGFWHCTTALQSFTLPLWWGEKVADWLPYWFCFQISLWSERRHRWMASCQLVKSTFESTAHFSCSERFLSS